MGETHLVTLVSEAEQHLRQYLGRTVLGLVLIASQAFVSDAILFTYALMLTRFYGVASDAGGLSILLGSALDWP